MSGTAVACAAATFLTVLVLLLHDTIADVTSEEACDPPPNADLVRFLLYDFDEARANTAACILQRSKRQYRLQTSTSLP